MPLSYGRCPYGRENAFSAYSRPVWKTFTVLARSKKLKCAYTPNDLPQPESPLHREEGRLIEAGLSVDTAASIRVVGTPRACMASPTRYSLKTGPMAARPSPPRGKRCGSRSFELNIEPLAARRYDFAQQHSPPITELGIKASELMSGVA